MPGGEAYGMLQKSAARHGIVLHGGSIIERDGEALYNTTVVFGSGRQRACPLPQAHTCSTSSLRTARSIQSATFSRGARTVCFDALGTRIGLSICYDVRFPELICSSPRMAPRSSWCLPISPCRRARITGKVLLRARAIETQTVARPRRMGPQRRRPARLDGHSLVVVLGQRYRQGAGDKVGYVAARSISRRLKGCARGCPAPNTACCKATARSDAAPDRRRRSSSPGRRHGAGEEGWGRPDAGAPERGVRSRRLRKACTCPISVVLALRELMEAGRTAADRDKRLLGAQLLEQAERVAAVDSRSASARG